MNIRKLAEIAGVSPATVSLVLNHKTGVSKKTREKVLKLAQKYNYGVQAEGIQPNRVLFVKYIKHGKIVEENAGFISAIMDSIENDCRSKGFSLSVLVSEGTLKNTLAEIDYDNLFGIILLGTELDEKEYKFLEKIEIPYVVVDNIMPHFYCNSVAIDNFEIVYQALSYLKGLGHREIAYFRSDIRIQNFIERANAFSKYSGRFGFSFEKVHEFILPPTPIGSYETMAEYLKQDFRLPTCAFADNDTIAMGAMKAIKEAGYRIPKDISVIGFDDIPFAAISSPSLTTMSVPKKTMGSLALRQLMLASEGGDIAVHKTRVQGELRVRESTV